MNAIFQTPVVKSDDELYIDILVTGSKERRKGVGTALLNHAFEIEGGEKAIFDETIRFRISCKTEKSNVNCRCIKS